jgi:enamine deaminase RidA (YjgF/YER057c/UK114 family)
MATRDGRTSHHPSGVSDALRAAFPAREGPAATWIRVGGLEGDGLLVEIEATAVVP